MKKIIYVILITLLIALPCFSQKNADREIARTQEYIGAATQKGAAKIAALKAYVKKFPDKSKKWTKLAFYQLAVESFQTKKYADCVKYSDQTLKMGAPGDGEEARLYLIIANSYAIKSASIFDKDKALKWVNKAIAFAQSKKLNDVIGQARKLKKGVKGKPAPQMPKDKKMLMHYSEGDYKDAIALYKTLSATDKAKPDIKKTYGNCLFKANMYNTALKVFEGLYANDKQALFATRLADIYAKKKLREKSINYYLEAGLLYKKEGKSSNGKAAHGKAQYQLFEKAGYNKLIRAYNAKVKRQRNSAAKNVEAIKKKKREIRKHKRHMYKTYESQDIAAPQYEHDKTDKLDKQLRLLKSGAPAGDTGGDDLEAKRKEILKDLATRLAAAKKRLGL